MIQASLGSPERKSGGRSVCDLYQVRPWSLVSLVQGDCAGNLRSDESGESGLGVWDLGSLKSLDLKSEIWSGGRGSGRARPCGVMD